ncbi:MAG: cohesin domain-containing protein [Oscillatoria sp. PMC 1051.18]|nr:cohesin domain-containing protein [Oscillatoria sp. PMC 1050.18]MEC5030151.1 cohesin domain-containing protein [Oscillatoria sp. PMC 1051.18]
MATITLPNQLTVLPGETFTVPITIDDATDLQAIDLVLNYDTDLLDISNEDVQLGDLLDNFTFVPNVDDSSGQIILSAFNVSSLTSGAGELFKLNFQVPDDAVAGSTTLDLVEELDTQQSRINEGVIPATLVDGSVTIDSGEISPETEETPLTDTTEVAKIEQEFLDLRDITGLQSVDFVVNREAAFDNFVGFYRIDSLEGNIGEINPNDANVTPEAYLAAALDNVVAGVDLSVGNQQTTTVEAELEGGDLLAPFIVANGRLDELLDNDASNDPEVYFPFVGVNQDGFDHIRLEGENTFGFEDLPNGGDRDYNDLAIQVNFT